MYPMTGDFSTVVLTIVLGGLVFAAFRSVQQAKTIGFKDGYRSAIQDASRFIEDPAAFKKKFEQELQ